jgi:hypothetical protein
MNFQGKFVYRQYDVEIDGKKVKTTGKDSVSSIHCRIMQTNKSEADQAFFPAVFNDGLIELVYMEDQDVLKKMKETGKRRAL